MAALVSIDVSVRAAEDLAAEMPVHGSIDPVVRTLDEQGMPWNEIVALVDTCDQELIHHYIELHGERLGEHLAQQMAWLADIERLLITRSSTSDIDHRASA